MYSYPLSTREVTFNMFLWWVAAAAKSLQSCLTLCDPIDGSPPGSPVPGILQARTLEWVPSPSPMHESKKWNWSRSVVYNAQRLHGPQPTRLFCPWDFPDKSTGVGGQCPLHLWWVQFSSVIQSCPTLCDPMNHRTPGLPVYHQLPEFTQTHVHRDGNAIQASHPLSSPSPPVPNPSEHQGLFQWVKSSHEIAKVLDFQLQHQSFQRTPRTDLL